jgi:hypothetical protein
VCSSDLAKYKKEYQTMQQLLQKDKQLAEAVIILKAMNALGINA